MRVTIAPGERESAAAAEFLDSDRATYPPLTINLAPGDPVTVVTQCLPVRAWAMYLLVLSNGTVYVGHTCRPRLRMKEHAATAKWAHVVTVVVTLLPSEFDARAMEFDMHEHEAGLVLISTLTAHDRARLDQLSREVLVAKALRAGASR